MKRFALVIFMALLAAVLVIAPCLAEDAPDSTVSVITTTGTALAVALGELLTNTILPVLVTLFGSLAALLLLKLKNWLNIKTSAEFDTWVSGRAEEAVQYVGEVAAERLKAKNITIKGHEKLDMAMARLIKNVPEISRDAAEVYVKAALARIHGEGATGAAVLK